MILYSRKCPPYCSGQMAKAQTVDGTLAAQTVIGIIRKHAKEAHAAKLDIRAALPSIASRMPRWLLT